MKFKAIIRRMGRMCPLAWYIFSAGLRLSCLLLFAALVLLIKWDGSMTEGYFYYMTALSLAETTQGILLISVLGSVCIEDFQS